MSWDGTEIYLGDGLYASFDGWAIWLRAPRENDDHVVALEPSTYAALIRYADDVKKKRFDENKTA